MNEDSETEDLNIITRLKNAAKKHRDEQSLLISSSSIIGEVEVHVPVDGSNIVADPGSDNEHSVEIPNPSGGNIGGVKLSIQVSAGDYVEKIQKLNEKINALSDQITALNEELGAYRSAAKAIALAIRIHERD